MQQALQHNAELIGNRSIAELVDLPEMTNAETLSIIEIGNRIMPAAFNAGSFLFHLIGSLTVKLSIQYGNAPSSCFSYSTYGTILCKFTKDISSAIHFGQLALDVLYKYHTLPVKASVLTVFALFIKHRNAHLRETIPILKDAYTTALETGDFEYSGYSAYGHCIAAFWSGQPLSNVQQDTNAYVHDLAKRGQLTTANYCRIYLQTIHNLLGLSQSPTVFSGEILEGSELLTQLRSQKDLVGIYFYYLYNMLLGLLFEDAAQARAHAIEGRLHVMSGAALFTQSLFYFYDSLIALMALTPSDEDFQQIMDMIEENQMILRDDWALHSPMNHQHKIDLIEAEKCRVLGKITEAMDYYDRAISGAQNNEFVHDTALAYELAAKFYFLQGRTVITKAYIQEARYFYDLWGSHAKVRHMEEKYFQLLVGKTKTVHRHTTRSINITSGVSASASLDISTIIKANQAIASEIVLESLLKTLLNILLENAGAETGCLLLQKESLEIAIHSQLIEAIPGNLPESILYYVARTQELVLLDNASTQDKFDQDLYIQTVKPLSILCYPLINQGKLIGIIYLENNMIAGAFTEDRIALIRLLSGQAAIAITNAMLYREREQYTQTLEEKVKERTAELRTANDELSRLANLDGLTKILNRRSFDNALAKEWRRHVREQQSLALIFMDIDYFKRFNDHYGHQCGDDCLIQVAQTIAVTLKRSTDLACRYGGEEFVVILPNTDSAGAFTIAERIRTTVLRKEIHHEKSEVNPYVTLSLGVIGIVPGLDMNPEQLVAMADEALYSAKHQGRNRAIIFSPSVAG